MNKNEINALIMFWEIYISSPESVRCVYGSVLEHYRKYFSEKYKGYLIVKEFLGTSMCCGIVSEIMCDAGTSYVGVVVNDEGFGARIYNLRSIQLHPPGNKDEQK